MLHPLEKRKTFSISHNIALKPFTSPRVGILNPCSYDPLFSNRYRCFRVPLQSADVELRFRLVYVRVRGHKKIGRSPRPRWPQTHNYRPPQDRCLLYSVAENEVLNSIAGEYFGAARTGPVQPLHRPSRRQIRLLRQPLRLCATTRV